MTQQPEAQATGLGAELAQESFMQLWQSYCDKKSECEDLRERITTLEAALRQAVEALEMWCPMTATYLNTRDQAITAAKQALKGEET